MQDKYKQNLGKKWTCKFFYSASKVFTVLNVISTLLLKNKRIFLNIFDLKSSHEAVLRVYLCLYVLLMSSVR